MLVLPFLDMHDSTWLNQQHSSPSNAFYLLRSRMPSGQRRALINMESRASLNSSTSDVPATNWKAPRERATLSIMNLHHEQPPRRRIMPPNDWAFERREEWRGEGERRQWEGESTRAKLAGRHPQSPGRGEDDIDSRKWRHSASLSRCPVADENWCEIWRPLYDSNVGGRHSKTSHDAL